MCDGVLDICHFLFGRYEAANAILHVGFRASREPTGMFAAQLHRSLANANTMLISPQEFYSISFMQPFKLRDQEMSLKINECTSAVDAFDESTGTLLPLDKAKSLPRSDCRTALQHIIISVDIAL